VRPLLFSPFGDHAEIKNLYTPANRDVADVAEGGARAGYQGAVLNIQDFLRLLRARWIIVCVTVAIGAAAAVAVTLVTTPQYEASTRLFVSTTSSTSVSDIYQGNRFSQERVASYTEILMGETLAQRTIAKMGLDMRPKELQGRITASAKIDTVLIDVAVRDASPIRARDIADALSDEFVVMVSELETRQDASTPDARAIVEQRASIPEEPVSPKPLLNLAIGLAAGVLLGVGLAFLRDRLDNTVKDRETLEEITGVGDFGSIPLDKKRRKEPAISFESDNSSIAEAFRKLRTNLQFLAVDNPPRVIVITSSLASEGKSTTAINLALALAESEHNVVLVDADLRRPKLDKYLDLIGSVGFSTVLANRASIDDVLQKTRFPRLTVLTSGAVPPNPSALLGSVAAQKILAELRSRFDYVIVDSSPLLAVTDAAILAADADGVLIAAQFGRTKRAQLAHAVRHLADVRASLLGAIFTMTPAGRFAPYSYNYYYYYGDRGAASAAESVNRERRSLNPLQPKHGRRAPDQQRAQPWSESGGS
jgi:capsular exopolysaccharide synthesis family protein